MTIDGSFYRNDVRQVLKSGPMKLDQIKARLAIKNIKIDETQILDALNSLIKARIVTRSEGKFALVTLS